MRLRRKAPSNEPYPPDRDDFASNLWVSIIDSDGVNQGTIPFVPGQPVTIQPKSPVTVTRCRVEDVDGNELAFVDLDAPVVARAWDTVNIDLKLQLL